MNTRHIRKILLIDDDTSVLNSLRRVLEDAGYTVQAVKNGRQGMQWLEQEKADLIITDIYMDVMDGLEIVTAVKKSHPGMKLIVMSGGSKLMSADVLPIAKALGANRTLQKPLDMDVLLAAIAELDAPSAV